MHDPALCSLHSKINQKRHRNPFLQNVMFLTIVHQNRCIQFCHTLFTFDRHFSLFADQNCDQLVLHLDLKLPEILFHKFQNVPDQLITIAVAVKLLLPLACCRLKHQTSFLQNRPDTHFGNAILVPRPACCHMYQLFTDTLLQQYF